MLDVRLMRWVDAQLGNVLCNGLALRARVFKRSSTPPPAVPKKIAVMKFFGMGSIVVASPALSALREAYPNAEIHLVTFQSNRELVELLTLTDRNWFVDTTDARRFLQSTLEVAWGLRRAGIELVLDLEFFAKFPLVLSELAGIPHKAGFYLTQENWRRVLLDCRGAYNHYFHTKDIFLSLVYLLQTGDIYYLHFDAFRARHRYPARDGGDHARAHVAGLLSARGILTTDPLYVLNPNTSPELAPEVRKWPEERYAELARKLVEREPRAACIVIGSRGEKAYVDRIVRAGESPRIHSFAGETNLRQLLALFERATLVISNDSGPMHLACLVDAPILGLFFADSPTLFAPLSGKADFIAPSLYCIPLFSVYNGKDVVAGHPMETIRNAAARTVSVDEVLERAVRLIETERASQRRVLFTN